MTTNHLALLLFNYGSPESRTQILRTGILRAIHYTKDPNLHNNKYNRKETKIELFFIDIDKRAAVLHVLVSISTNLLRLSNCGNLT